MLDLKDMDKKAKERGYWLHNKTANDTRYNYLKDSGLGLIIYPKTDEFEIYYNIDLIVSLQGGKCGSFMNDKHFKRQESNVEKYMNIIKYNTL